MPTAGKNCLGGKVYVVCVYRVDATTGAYENCASLDLENGHKEKMSTKMIDLTAQAHYADDANAAKLKEIVKVYEIDTLHAILGVGDGTTGNLLMQYPRSTVSMDASTESGKMQLRVYLGSILNRPENVFVFRNVAFNGIRKVPWADTASNLDTAYAGKLNESGLLSQSVHDFVTTGKATGLKDDVFMCNGTIYKDDTAGDPRILRSNDGLLGTLDSIEKCRAFMGAQVFEDQHFMTGVGRQ